MSDEITIRHATPADIDSFRELRLEALKNHPTAFGADYEESAVRPNEYWQERLEFDKNQEALFFAEHESQLAGMTGIFRSSSKKRQHKSTIWGVYVKPEWRGHHISETLVRSCLGWAKEQGSGNCQIGCSNNKSTSNSLLRTLRICHLWQRTKSALLRQHVL